MMRPGDPESYCDAFINIRTESTARTNSRYEGHGLLPTRLFLKVYVVSLYLNTS
jgi:hypothetical protein